MNKKIKSIFASYPEVKLAYLFGSRANGQTGPMSDYDFAVYLDEKDAMKRFNTKLTLMSDLGRLLKSDDIDVVILNDIDNPILSYHVISEGRVLYEQEPFKVMIEPGILNQYCDFKQEMIKHNLYV